MTRAAQLRGGAERKSPKRRRPAVTRRRARREVDDADDTPTASMLLGGVWRDCEELLTKATSLSTVLQTAPEGMRGKLLNREYRRLATGVKEAVDKHKQKIQRWIRRAVDRDDTNGSSNYKSALSQLDSVYKRSMDRLNLQCRSLAAEHGIKLRDG